MISGSKDMAERIREEIRDFLRTELHLELSMEKTLIPNLTDQRIGFLGYEIAKTRANTAITRETLGTKNRTANEPSQLLVPAKAIRGQLQPFNQRERRVQ